MTNFSITIVSDPVCPWCYIGKTRLDKAIALYKKVYPGGRHDTFTVDWKAYYLDPSAPAQGISWAERQMQKLASSKSRSQTDNAISTNGGDREELAQQLRDRLASIGRQEGMEFSFRGKIGNTRSAHRAIAFSKTQSHGTNTSTSTNSESGTQVQDQFVMALFAAYFEGTADITSHKTLADVGESVGLDRMSMLAWLDDGKGEDEVDEEARVAKEDLGIKGVPCFRVQGHTVEGAQDVQAFLELFVRVKEEEEQAQARAEPGLEAKSAFVT
ncbi:thioredoxin-like protein [Xylariaceae sp. AK1471]|nr:thioredoxin-like protein [Xylariaceae sp. AK1471]